MTVVPLYCAKFIRLHHENDEAIKKPKSGFFARFERNFNDKYERMLNWYERLAKRAMERPGLTAAAILAGVVLVLAVHIPISGPRLLSTYRSRAIHHQRANAKRHAA